MTPMYQELYIRTQPDEKDLESVVEIYSEDEDGNEIVCAAATRACFGLHTCADQGDDLWNWLRDQVARRLEALNITYEYLLFETGRADSAP